MSDISVTIVEEDPEIISVVFTTEDSEDIFITVGDPTGPQGPQGIQGEQGPQGIPGPGDTFRYIHEQLIPSTTWTITHNLNGYPNVTALSSDGSVVEGDLTYVDLNVVVMDIAWAISGVAYLS